MGLIDLSGLPENARVTVDSAPIIYLLDGRQQFLDPFEPLFKKIESGKLRAVVSVITLAEVVAGPLRENNEILADRYFRALTSSANWTVQPLDAELSFLAARIRVRYALKLPDAIQVATTIKSGSSALVTHDRDFRSVDEISILGL